MSRKSKIHRKLKFPSVLENLIDFQHTGLSKSDFENFKYYLSNVKYILKYIDWWLINGNAKQGDIQRFFQGKAGNDADRA